MPRRKPERSQRPVRPLIGDDASRVEAGPGHSAADGYVVRAVPGGRATKTYRCPGCDHEIAVGVAHVVVWPVDEVGGVDERRHWHRGCWAGRRTRGITRRWS